MSEYFIHPNGTANLSDGDAGSLSNPFGTIQEGIDVAVNPGDIVSIIHDDTLGDPIHPLYANLICNNSGTAANPIVIRGVDKEGISNPYVIRAKVDMLTVGTNHFIGTGMHINCKDLDLGNWNGALFYVINTWKIERVRQVQGTADGVEVWGSYFEYNCRHSLFIDCEQITSRFQFISEGNTVGGNIFYRCYSNFGFTCSGERKSNQFMYCVSNGASVGFIVRFTNWSTVGGSIYGCIALNCGTGFTFGSGVIMASKLTVIGSTGNGIELYDTGSYGGSLLLTDSIIMNSGGYGLERIDSTCQILHEERNFWYNNTSGNIKDSIVSVNSYLLNPLIDGTTLRISTESPARRKNLDMLDYYSTKTDSGAINSEDIGLEITNQNADSYIVYENEKLNFYANGVLVRSYS